MVVDFRNFDIVAGDMGVGPKKFYDVKSKFRICANKRTRSTAPNLSEVLNRLKLFDFIFSSPGLNLILCRLNQLICFLCPLEIFNELVFVLVKDLPTASVVDQVIAV